MDRHWMNLNRTSTEYMQGVEEFIAAALEYKLRSGTNIRCPCCDCNNMRFLTNIHELKDHLIRRGFVNGCTRWTWHGEAWDYVQSSSSCAHTTAPMTHNPVDSNVGDEDEEDNDRMDEMLANAEDNFTEKPHVFESILKASKTKLFPGCEKYTTLSTFLILFNLKTRHNVTDEFFSALLETLADMFPAGNTLPTSTYRAKKLMCPMGLEYEKIHACSKDCVLYRNEYVDLQSCPRCGMSHYKKQHSSDSIATKKGVPAKVLWYLPIIPRFKRLFSDEKNAKLLRWHSEVRKVDGLMRHPADSPQWRNINSMFPEFGHDPRNLRLGLSTDGMNPFGTLSSQYNTWPVILTIYNLPPWLCMKRRYMMLSLLISGPKQPGNDIDVYLAPLIEDLKFLWNEGVTVFLSSSDLQT